MKHYTTLKQSNKLLELGLSPKSADMYYLSQGMDDFGKKYYSLDVDEGYNDDISERDIPCWSVGALLELMPKIGANEPKLCKRYYVDAPIVRYVCTYGLLKETKEYCNPVDACYEIIVWLKENCKI